MEKLNISDKITFKQLFSNTKNAEELINYFETEDMSFDYKGLIEIKEKLSNNVWYKYFKNEFKINNVFSENIILNKSFGLFTGNKKEKNRDVY